MNFLKKIFGSRPEATSCCGVDHRKDGAHPHAKSADGACETHACTPDVAERPAVQTATHAAGHGCCE